MSKLGKMRNSNIYKDENQALRFEEAWGGFNIVKDSFDGKSFEIDNLRYDDEHQIIGDIYAMDYKRACKWIRKIHKEQNVDFSEYKNINNESVK